MIYIRWRILITSLLHHFVLLGAVLIFLWAVFLSILRVFLVVLPEHQNIVANILSPIVGAPITFSKLQINWHRLEPEVTLQNVNVEGQEGQALMRIPEVTVRISLFSSLLHRKIEIGLLQVKEWRVRVYQDEQDQWRVAGIDPLNSSENTLNNKVEFVDFIGMMEQIQHLQLHQSDMIIQAKHQPSIKLTDTNLDWYGEGNQFSLYGNTLLQGPSEVPLRFAAIFNGSEIQNLTGRVYLKLSNLDLTPWLSGKVWDHFEWEHGIVTGELWGGWHKDHWENASAKLQLSQINIQQADQEKLWEMTSQSANVELEGQFDDQHQNINFRFLSDPGKFVLGHIFRSPMPYEKLTSQGEWSADSQGNNLIFIQPIFLKTLDADTASLLRIRWSKILEPTMDLCARAHFEDLHSVSHNLPAGIMPRSVVKWLDHAITGGSASDAEMLWRGPLKHFPFHDQTGTMQIYGKVNDVFLNYAPHWPSINHLNADLYFTSHDMHILAEQGTMSHLSVANAVVDIPEFKKASHLQIHDHLQADLTNAWQFLQNSPLKSSFSFLVDQTIATGPFTLNLNMDLPLSRVSAVQYDGELDLNHDQLDLLSTPIHLHELSGHLSFDNQNLQSKDLQAIWFDELWHVALSKRVTSEIQIDFSGMAPLETWVKQEFQFASSWVKGKTNMIGRVIVGAQNKTFSLKLNSSLQGVTVSSPFGEKKTAETRTPFSMAISKKINQPTMFNMSLAFPQGSIRAVTKGEVWNISTPKIAGTIVEPSFQNHIWEINLTNADFRNFKSLDTSAIKINNMPPLDILANKVILPSGMAFNSIQLEVRPQADGSILLNDFVLNQNAFQITAHGGYHKTPKGFMSYLSGELTAPKLENVLATLKLPPLAEATKTVANFDLSWPGALWAFDRKVLQGQLKITTDQGIFKDVSDQTISKINLGRMLDLLSLSELPSHLTSKFNDMTQRGFPFNQLTGKMKLTPPQIRDMDIQVAGPVANVTLNGCINTEREQLNLVADLSPKLTGSLPLIATLAGGPIMGAIGFVANEVISPAVGKLSESYYAIAGDAENPKTTKINRIQAQQMLQDCPL